MFYWQFAAAILLPFWVLLSRGIIRAEDGWDFALYLVLAPLLAVAMLAVAGLTYARKEVRTSRAVSWQDVAVLGVWHAAIVVYGFIALAPLAAVVALITVGAFWSAVWQLFSETRTRVKNAFSLDPIDAGSYTAQKHQADVGPATGPDAGRVIILNPDGSSSERGN